MLTLANNVRQRRLAKGWTIKELAARAYLPVRVIENLEEEIASPNFVAVVWLAEALECTMDQLVKQRKVQDEQRHTDRPRGAAPTRPTD